MKITKLSNDFTPIRKGIYFNVETEGDTPTNIIVEIVDSLTSEVIATKLLRGVTSAKVNIAPYLSRFEERKPMQNLCTSISGAPYAEYKVRVDDIESEAVMVSVNNIEAENTPTIISAMPNTRRISYGESDEVLIISKEGRNICAEITADNGEQLNIEHHATTGANILTISTEDFGANTHSLDVVLRCDGEEFGSLHYQVTAPIKTSTRLAWLSDKGSIERYTFPVSYEVKHTVEKGAILTTDGVQTTHCRTKQNIALASRFEPTETIAALAGIASSTKVWWECNGELKSVEVTTRSIEQSLFGAPDSIRIEISTLNEEERVW